jgi:hypothetical protein
MSKALPALALSATLALPTLLYAQASEAADLPSRSDEFAEVSSGAELFFNGPKGAAPGASVSQFSQNAPPGPARGRAISHAARTGTFEDLNGGPA